VPLTGVINYVFCIYYCFNVLHCVTLLITQRNANANVNVVVLVAFVIIDTKDVYVLVYYLCFCVLDRA